MSPGDLLAHPNSALLQKGPVQLRCPYGAANATPWQFPEAGSDTLWQINIKYSQFVDLLRQVCLFLFIISFSNCFLPQPSSPGLSAACIPGMLYSKLQQQKTLFHLSFLLGLFVIFSAKLVIRNLSLWRTANTSSHLYLLGISGFVSSALVKLVMQG